MFDVAEKIFTVEEYLELEKSSDVRHEFYYGKLIPMAGESKNANRIARYFIQKFERELEAKRLEVFFQSVKLEVEKKGIYRYPDVVIAPESDDEHTYFITKPAIIVEVLSDSTAYIDRGAKIRQYCGIQSLDQYLIVAQDQIAIELYTNQGNGKDWRYNFYSDPDDEIELSSLDVSFRLGELYQKVKFTP